MLRLSSLNKGTVIAALIASFCLIDSAKAQIPGGPAAPVRSTVVAGIAGEATPITKKKYVGNVEAIEEVDSVARVSGVLTVAPGFEEGKHVSKGQLLFTIDPVPYQAKVDAAKATIQQLKAQIDYAEKNFKRAEDLLQRNAASKNDMESAESTLLSLQAQLLGAEAQLVLAEEDLGYTQIKSEIDGRAGRRSYSTGNYVSLQSSPLVKVVQTDPIYVRFTMSERDYLSMFKNFDDLKNNSKLSLTLPNDSTYPLEGEISFVDNTVKSTTDTIKVWATFKNPNETLNPGGVVTVNLAKYAETKTASIEPSAGMFDGKTNYVYILVDSIDDEQLYQEIKNDSRFAKSVEAMEAAINAVVSGNDAAAQFLEDFGKNPVVERTAEELSRAIDEGDADAALVQTAANLGQMKNLDVKEALGIVKEEGAEAWTKMFLDAFKKERYVYQDPRTNEERNDFADNKVSEKYLMTLRRDITLGPSGDQIETILSGVEPNEIVVLDGVHKARPFDLVIPVYRDKQNDEAKTQAKKAAPVDKEPTVQKTTKSGNQEAKRVDSKKKVASQTTLAGEADA
ncbi:MAG: efflux RND transporter periplasmic adaptor subunit [Thermoguttaceae bacterium]|nr:efflux RND transporter periplasmic adaptor subunit [Thermoguttaceae bacterium]